MCSTQQNDVFVYLLEFHFSVSTKNVVLMFKLINSLTDRKQKSQKADCNTVKRKRQANYNLRMNAVHVQLFRLIALNFNRIFTAARMSKTCPGMQP